MERDAGLLASNKTLTTHANPAGGALVGARRALASAGRNISEVASFIHGTTLATNALLERKGATVAAVTTEGFRDILEIAYERRYSQYDLSLRKPDYLVPRERCLTIRERMSARGEPLIPLDEDAVAELLHQIDASSAEAVAICLLHAYANPNHEERLRKMITAARPGLAVSISSEVSPEAREFDRLCTTIANAYVQPLMANYLADFAESFAAEGLSCPILMMTAGGGMTTLETARRFPIRLVESGPAGGAILASRVAMECGLDQVLSFDMGGTTAKLCLIDGGRPQTSRQFEVSRAERFIKGSGMPLRIPVIEMIEIGAGGGSIASVDRLGRLVVGPRSAGSEPGPVAFARGGEEPTVTDADALLGYLRPDLFAEGQFDLNLPAARAAMEERVASPLGCDLMSAADGVGRIVDENMASAGRMHAVESGKDLAQRTMIAFGGNGPLHACRVARSAGVKQVLIPTNPSVGSALGFLYAPVSFELVRSRYSLLGQLDFEGVNALLSEMQEEASAVVRQGAPDAPIGIRRSAYMRYLGQGHEIEIELPPGRLSQAVVGPMARAFEAAYAEQFSRPVPGMEIEIMNWALRAATPPPFGEPRPCAPPHPHPIGESESCDIYCDVERRRRPARLVARGGLSPGHRLIGPALITEAQTTTFVAGDFCAEVDARGNLILTRIEVGGRHE